MSNRMNDKGKGKASKSFPSSARSQQPKPKNMKKVSRPSQGSSMSSSEPIGVAAAYSTGKSPKPAKIKRAGDSVRICHEELVSSVTGTDAFTQSAVFALNPGLQSSFPWLSSQAQGWERYRFHRLRYVYYTRCGSDIPGSVMIAPDYDAADPAPVSEQVMSSYRNVVEDAPWKNIICELDVRSLNSLGPSRFVRSFGLSANQDIKTYDSGNVFIFTMDGTAVRWGKVWVEYDVELITPQLGSGGNALQNAFSLLGVTPTTAAVLGTQSEVSGSNPIGVLSNSVFTFAQAGNFFVKLHQRGTTVTVNAEAAVSASGTLIGSERAGSGTSNSYQGLQITAVVGTTVTYNNTIVAGTLASFDVFQLPSALEDGLTQ